MPKTIFMITATHLHAILVHFPIALLLIAFFSELISLFYQKIFLKNVALYLLILGTIGTIASYWAGNVAGEGIEEGTLATAVELHEQAATFALWLTIITAFIYLVIEVLKYEKKWSRVIAILFFVSSIVAITRTGYLGGELVYKHGAGVELELPDFNKTDISE